MKKLILVVAFALVAASCGGSDGDSADSDVEVVDGDQTEANDGNTDESTATGGSDGDGSEGNASDSDGSATDGSDAVVEEAPNLPPPIAVELIQERDCAHNTNEIAADDGSAVELPPAVKPVVDDEFLVEVDELIVTDLIVGTGVEATTGTAIDMQYVGVVTDGTQFDASWDRGAQPFSFTLGSGQVIAGWDEGIVGMRVGGRRVLQIPSDLAYGDTARSDVIVANSDLIFIVDLIGTGAAAPTIDADELGSFDELEIVDLVEGAGCTAELGDIITMNYVAVNAETGIEVDNSWASGAPATIAVGRAQVIDAWNQGLVGMKVGGERLLKVPGELTFGEEDLVFRIHLDSLIESPLAHRIELEGPAPEEITATTLVEGSGPGAAEGDILDVSVAVLLYDADVIAQSSWLQGAPSQIVLQAGALPPGLEESLRGIQLGETRQIIVPPDEPEAEDELGLVEDTLVFVVEVLRITSAEG